MKNTYYPKENTLTVEIRGRMIGFRGGIAERVLQKLIATGQPVHIGDLKRPADRQSNPAGVHQH